MKNKMGNGMEITHGNIGTQCDMCPDKPATVKVYRRGYCNLYYCSDCWKQLLKDLGR